jgi:hypothetical protein
LMLEDETPPNNYDKQQRIAAGIKALVANETQWCHGKGDKAITLKPYSRVSVSVNNSPAHLRAVPISDETLDDKLLILEAYPNATVKLVEKLGGQEAFGNKLHEELPAYIYHQLNEFQIPEELKATRFGMDPWRNPNIVKAVKDTEPYVHMLEYMRVLYPTAQGLFKTGMQILQDFTDNRDPQGIAPKSPKTFFEYLSKVSDMAPKEFAKKKTKHANGYILNFLDTAQET